MIQKQNVEQQNDEKQEEEEQNEYRIYKLKKEEFNMIIVVIKCMSYMLILDITILKMKH